MGPRSNGVVLAKVSKMLPNMEPEKHFWAKGHCMTASGDWKLSVWKMAAASKTRSVKRFKYSWLASLAHFKPFSLGHPQQGLR